MANRNLTFGMVNVAVRTAPALDDTTRIKGRYADPLDLGTVKQQYVNEAGDVVTPTKVYEYNGKLVELDKDEVSKLSPDGTINLEAYVDAVPSEFVISTALVTPQKGNGPAFDLVADYLRRTGRAFIGRATTSGTTKGLAISWSSEFGCVIEQVLCFAAQVRQDKVNAAHAAVGTADPAMTGMADAIFAALPAEFDYTTITDAYGIALEAAVAAKSEGKAVPSAPAAPEPAPAADLMALLKASVPA